MIDQEKLKVKRWRHELQKAFLPKSEPIKEEVRLVLYPLPSFPSLLVFKSFNSTCALVTGFSNNWKITR